MATSKRHEFQTIRSEGGLLPPDLLRRVLDPKEKLDGTRPEDYGLPQGERLNEVITQSWNRLRKHWAEFRAAAEHLPETESGTGLTNDKWSLPLLRELGFGLLPTTAGPEVEGRSYAISRFFGPVPIHLVGCGLSLDRRAVGVRGAAAANPHGLVQEFINRGAGHLWAIVSNGLRLRLLRRNQALSRQSFLEFDLESMFSGELYSDFVLLWLVAHATRFAPREENKPDSCWLELWTKFADEQGTRALGELRGGVEKALQILGEGFTSHPKNTALRGGLRAGHVTLADFHGQLLRIVYRLIFLFVAEDRTLDGLPLLHPRDGSEAAKTARERFARHYGTARLREMAAKIRGSRHGDLWRQFQLIVSALSGDANFAATREALALPALGSFLWNPNSTSAMNVAELTNHDFLEALRDLAFTRQGKVLRPVDYENLGAEELGGVYETLLALTPQINADGSRFTFAEFAGNERKTSGAYYTPDSLVQCLLDSALDPVVENAIKGKSGVEAESAVLGLRICDPAVGSGHFLVGAAHRLAIHLARVRALAQGESEASALIYQHALRDVIGHCLYGVDVNPMAAELCRVSLWLEAIEPGKPLSFLEHRIQCGNSLLGATPALLAKGIPEEAFNPIEGDDKEICKEFKRVNKDEHNLQRRLFAATTEPWQQLGNLAVSLANLNAVADDSLEGIREKQRMYQETIRSANYLSGRFWADTWCSAFVWKKTREFNYPITEEVFRRIEHNPNAVDPWMRDEIQRLSSQYQFFHWHLAFPDVFQVGLPGLAPNNEQTGWIGGFDCILGNPPWERVKLQEKEWFAERSPDIANAPNAAIRKRLIEALRTEDPKLQAQFTDAMRHSEAESHYLRNSGLYPLCGRGDINLYAVFAEAMANRLNSSGFVGAVLPSGVATDDTTKLFFQRLIDTESLVSFFDFWNRKQLFAGVQAKIKFCLLTISNVPHRFFRVAAQLEDLEMLKEPGRVYELSPNDVRRINPNTRNCPTFVSSNDAEINRAIYASVPIISKEEDIPDGQWSIEFSRMFDMTNEARHFRTFEQLSAEGFHLVGNHFRKGEKVFSPLYEAKLSHQYDHRAATFEGVPLEARFRVHAWANETQPQQYTDPNYASLPRFWISHTELLARVKSDAPWLFGFRNTISAVADSRSLVASLLPIIGVGNSLPLIYFADEGAVVLFLAAFNSITLDYIVRQKASGGNLNYYIVKQLPLPTKASFFGECDWSLRGTVFDWLVPRVLELTYTSWDLEPFAHNYGSVGPPFRWDEGRRFVLRCEVDAAFFLLYLPTGADGDWRQGHGESAEDLARLKSCFPSPRGAAEYILDTFPIVRRKDEEECDGDYRTKRVILEIYDTMQECIRTRQPYQTRLDPPPADPRCRHAKLGVGILAYGSLINDPGDELNQKIILRIKTQSPFPVEYGRYSRTRGGAPTLVPHQTGAPVAAEILVLDATVTVDEARDKLWRRERRRVGSGETYVEGTSANSVLVRQFSEDPRVSTILYTDFHDAGKIPNPTAGELAEHAIQSIEAADEGMDGITYLIKAIKCGIETPLTPAYKAEILRQTNTNSLEEALVVLRGT